MRCSTVHCIPSTHCVHIHKTPRTLYIHVHVHALCTFCTQAKAWINTICHMGQRLACTHSNGVYEGLRTRVAEATIKCGKLSKCHKKALKSGVYVRNMRYFELSFCPQTHFKILSSSRAHGASSGSHMHIYTWNAEYMYNTR